MNRLQRCFNDLKENGKKALIPYITAGDPDLGVTGALMDALVENGADIIELGIPFSDPVADGPTIQKAHERALKSKTRLQDIFQLVADFRKHDDKTPVVLMGYLNPVEIMGARQFAEKAKAAGVDGILLVDCPPEESEGLTETLQTAGLETIYLASPNTQDNRLGLIKNVCSGYLYYVSLKGVTGSATLQVDDVKAHVLHLRKHIDIPICVGFGIRDPETASLIAKTADGIIIGSAIVSIIQEHLNDNEKIINKISEFVRSVRDALS